MNLLASDNHLFTLARRGTRLTHGLLAVALASVIALAPGLLLNQLLHLLGWTEPSAGVGALAGAAGFVLRLAGAFLPIILLVGLWVMRYERRPLSTLGLEPRAVPRQYGRGALAGLVMFGALVVGLALGGMVGVEPSGPGPVGVAALGGVLLVALGWMIQGAAEEILFRGWLLPTLGARHSPWIGLVVSSLLFAGLHSLNPNMSLLAFANLFLFGVFMALYALRASSVWGACALHSVWNWAQGNLFGLQVSGNNSAGGMLLNLVETGPDAITGGGFGLEGGLAITVVLLLSSAVVVWTARPTTRPTAQNVPGSRWTSAH